MTLWKCRRVSVHDSIWGIHRYRILRGDRAVFVLVMSIHVRSHSYSILFFDPEAPTDKKVTQVSTSMQQSAAPTLNTA